MIALKFQRRVNLLWNFLCRIWSNMDLQDVGHEVVEIALRV